MTAKDFSIVFDGLIVPGFPRQSAIDNLASLYQIPPGSSTILFSGTQWILKQNITWDLGRTYCDELERLGARCKLVPTHSELDHATRCVFCLDCRYPVQACICVDDADVEQQHFDASAEYQKDNKRSLIFLQYGTAALLIAVIYNEYLAAKQCSEPIFAAYLIGIILLATGSYFLARLKGYNPGLMALLTLIPPIGIPILLGLRNKRLNEKRKLFSISNGIPLMIVGMTLFIAVDLVQTNNELSAFQRYSDNVQIKIDSLDIEQAKLLTPQIIGLIEHGFALTEEYSLSPDESNEVAIRIYHTIKTLTDNASPMVKYVRRQGMLERQDEAFYQAFKPLAQKLLRSLTRHKNRQGFCIKYNQNYMNSEDNLLKFTLN